MRDASAAYAMILYAAGKLFFQDSRPSDVLGKLPVTAHPWIISIGVGIPIT
jgi:hypothetical protein